MAKQVGIIKLKGTIGDLNFYKTKNAGPLARKAGGGFSKDQKKKPVRTMENASEFGRCSKTKKAFKMALAPFLCVRKDGDLHGRMVQLFTRIKDQDRINSRGMRGVGPGVETPRGRQLLKDFEFTPSCNVMETLAASGNFDFTTRSLNISNFDMRNVQFPTGATHLALTLGLLHFDFNSLENQLKSSAPLYLDKSYSANSIEMQVNLPDVAGTAIAVLGLKFYQEVQGTYYLFRSANSVGVENLGVEY
ncbi:hypothetical protein [Aequorivita marisscotiae]|uniref:Uncharacterized protein n=1 Tax=Aequorivita marisscotiae TaxID=3040348 RepID=A0ABY8KUP4_9FLAO|nr:hypothetical protein [Aequorivita sp. Ant34-E75]WGF91422.1 hypothetical protein QCQ61_09365 [Aequorivita sp. Ant34-E75]